MFKRLITLTLLLLAFNLGGCAGETVMSTTAKGLLSSRLTVIGLAETTDALCSKGLIKQPDCDTAKDAYTKAQTAYKTASDALLAWVATGTDANGTAATSLSTVNTLLGNMQGVVNTYTGGK